MHFLLSLPRVFLLVFFLQVHSTNALHNVTIDDNDPSIEYVGQWVVSYNDNVSYGGNHHYSNTPGGRATFTFTGSTTPSFFLPSRFTISYTSCLGVAVYYITQLWAGYSPPVSTLLSLDNGEPIWVDLSTTGQDEPYGIRWGISGLENTTHTLATFIGTNAAGQTGTWGESDGFT